MKKGVQINTRQKSFVRQKEKGIAKILVIKSLMNRHFALPCPNSNSNSNLPPN